MNKITGKRLQKNIKDYVWYSKIKKWSKSYVQRKLRRRLNRADPE